MGRKKQTYQDNIDNNGEVFC